MAYMNVYGYACMRRLIIYALCWYVYTYTNVPYIGICCFKIVPEMTLIGVQKETCMNITIYSPGI